LPVPPVTFKSRRYSWHMSSINDFDVSEFLGGKTDLARSLARRECGGRYEDAILVISSIISAFAALIWPRPEREWRCPEKEHAKLLRRFPDSKRFIEFWATYADPAQGSMRIAVPLLAEYLYEFEKTEALGGLKRLRPEELRHFPEELDGNVCTGDTADASEAEVLHACPQLTIKEVRKWSYPAVFYREVRSGFVHELSPTQFASHIKAGKSGAGVTYRNDAGRPYRRIHFDVEWLCRIVERMAERAYPVWQQSSWRCGLVWWSDGA
jgi:hypothetical protein